MDTCERCKKVISLEEAFTISHGKNPRWNMAYLCEGCADEVLKEEETSK